LPDGTPIQRLRPLDDFPAPPAPTPEKPGFPFFVPGVFGFKGPKPPLGVPSRQAGAQFPPTDLERNAAANNAQKPGAFFVDHCPANAPLKRFDVTAIQLPVQYTDDSANRDITWSNPQGRIYVLNADRAAVESGQKKPEPFAPLLNVGDCVEYHLTNALPLEFGGTVFDRLQETNEASIHQHMVEFDVLSSDGAANGWNYDQGADAGEVPGSDNTIIYRDFVQAEVRTNSFHDHLFPNVHQDSGLFGGSSVHPTGCTFHDPATGRAVRIGTIVDIHCPGQDDDYRNVSLFIEDQVPMFQTNDPENANDDRFETPPFGVPIFPAKFPSSNDDSSRSRSAAAAGAQTCSTPSSGATHSLRYRAPSRETVSTSDCSSSPWRSRTPSTSTDCDGSSNPTTPSRLCHRLSTSGCSSTSNRESQPTRRTPIRGASSCATISTTMAARTTGSWGHGGCCECPAATSTSS
jgi:hypothetical protein